MRHLTIFFKPLVSPLVSLGIVMVLWWAGSLFFDPFVLPSPLETLGRADRLCTPEFFGHLSFTLGRVMTGFVLSFIIGTLVGIMAHVLNITAWVEGLMMMVQVLPGLIVGVIFLLMVGVGSTAPVLLVVTMTTPLLAMNTAAALAKADPAMEGVIRSFNGTRWHVIRDLYIPLLVPAMRANAGMGTTMAMKVVLLGEFIAAENGLGFLINVSRIYFNMQEVLFYVVVILLFVLVVQLVISAVFVGLFKKYFYPG